jgi:lipid-A-disaccharide synthase
VLFAVGDASGDAHAAELVRVLRARRPELRCLGLGGNEMQAAGVELVEHQSALAVGGLLELLPDLPRIAAAWRRLAAALRAERPDLVVLVDSSGFNLPFARRARRLGVPTLYYVAPQIWAWRRGRIRKLARRVDRVAVILPFEVPFYERAGVPVTFVGHPLVERVARAAPRCERGAARAALGLDADSPLVALLPGSRRAEIRHILPLHLGAVRALHARAPAVRFALPIAPSLARAEVEGALAAAALPATLRLALFAGRSLEVLGACDAALLKPGTATLEAALLGRPMVVAARGSPLTAALLGRLLRVDFLAMPNLIAGEAIVPELMQRDATPERIADALSGLLAGPARDAQLAGLRRVAGALGPPGAAERAAALVEQMIGAGRTA